MPEPVPPGRPLFLSMLVDFTHELRAAGLAVGSGDVLTYCAALASLDPSDLVDLYWAGRSTTVKRHDQIPIYDRVFARFFLDEGDDETKPNLFPFEAKADAAAVLNLPEAEPSEGGNPDEEVRLGLMASSAEALRTKSFAACTPEELAVLRHIMARIRLTPPRRRTRRTVSARTGRAPDLRRTARETMRTHGAPVELFWRRRRKRPRRLILILDVSGSMADYSRNLLQFAYTTKQATARVEVFCFGTRLTRITRQLEHRRADEALDRAAKAVVDWDGGTRIGDCLAAFVRDWGWRGLCRGGIVIICSDGLDRGSPDTLATAMDRMSRLCHAVVWMNPHKGDDEDFQLNTLGMMVAAPYIDLLLSGHDLLNLGQLAARLPELR